LRRWLAAFWVFIPAMLLLDGDGIARQLSLSLAATVFLILLARRFAVDAKQIVCAIVVATAGEVVLSLGWGLYTYQHALIPLYVPPGHGLFYAMAVITARQSGLERLERPIAFTVLTAGTIGAIVSLVVLTDIWGALWWVLAGALIVRSHNRLLLSACVVYTTALEWIGTTIGNWTWAAEVPLLGLPSGNPPAGVAILYVLLDLIVVWLVTRLRGRVDIHSTSPVERRPLSAAGISR
jgi:hypothetical protein